MSILGKSLISTECYDLQDIEQVFSLARDLKARFTSHGDFGSDMSAFKSKVVAMVFAEPSTRTRLSFSFATHRLGMSRVTLTDLMQSSVTKGETLEDTLANVAALHPDLMILRCAQGLGVDEFLQSVPFPVISAGIGATEHPTQALLDAFTILTERGALHGEKVLIVGDVSHSRVANSNLMMLRKLGAEVAYCAPQALRPVDPRWAGVQAFQQLPEAVSWATCIMGLRIQRERHGEDVGLSLAEYRENYRLERGHLKNFREDGIILHPGPVIRGVEFSEGVMEDPRVRVLQQVSNGVFVRAALLCLIMGLRPSP